MVRTRICHGKKGSKRRFCVLAKRDKNGRITDIQNIGKSSRRDAATRAKAVCKRTGFGYRCDYRAKK